MVRLKYVDLYGISTWVNTKNININYNIIVLY